MNLDFDKQEGLIPVIIQHYATLQVLMLGYMNQEAFEKSTAEKRVTFYSRSKQRLWTKGETSGNFLEIVSIREDCDQDTLLIQARPKGVTCHTGATSCFKEETPKGFIYELEQVLKSRLEEQNSDSYTYQLSQRGIHKVAQKVGEEAVELVIEALRDDKELFLNEAADLLYHTLLLLQAKGYSLTEIEKVLKQRSK